MAKYKIDNEDICNKKMEEIVKVDSNYICHSRKNPWLIDLSCVIAENHRCVSISSRLAYQKNRKIIFFGFKDDAAVCKSIFEYAAECVLAHNADIEKQIKKEAQNCSLTSIRTLQNSYGNGFTDGLEKAYEEQKEHEKWGVVLATPIEVKNAVNNMGSWSVSYHSVENSTDVNAYYAGLEDGMNFGKTKRINDGRDSVK